MKNLNNNIVNEKEKKENLMTNFANVMNDKRNNPAESKRENMHVKKF